MPSGMSFQRFNLYLPSRRELTRALKQENATEISVTRGECELLSPEKRDPPFSNLKKVGSLEVQSATKRGDSVDASDR